MLRYSRRSQFGINSHLNTARGHMDEPGPGFPSRKTLTDLKSPLPDIRLAGGRDAVFYPLVDHDWPRTGQVHRVKPLRQQSIRAITESGSAICTVLMHVTQ